MVADPQGNPFYVMKPIPPAGARKRAERRLLGRPRSSASRWNELTTADPVAARRILRRAVRLDQRRRSCRWASMGEYRFFAHQRHDDRRGHAGRCPTAASRLALLHPRAVDLDQAAEAVKAGGGTIAMGPHGSSRRRPHHHRHRPAGRRVRPGRQATIKERRQWPTTSSPPACGSTRARRARRPNSTPPTFPDSRVGAAMSAPGDYPGGQQGDELTVEFTVLGQSLRRPQRRAQFQAQ